MPNFLSLKKERKVELFESLGINGKGPLLGIFLDHDLDKDHFKLVKGVIEGAKAIHVNVVILADSQLKELRDLDTQILPYGRKNRHFLLEAADLALSMPFNDVEEMLLHGTVPVSIKRAEVEDYDPNSEKGNAFVYESLNVWSVFAALVRALETFKFPYDWKHIVREGVESVGKTDLEF